jgi:hypothetical protein
MMEKSQKKREENFKKSRSRTGMLIVTSVV